MEPILLQACIGGMSASSGTAAEVVIGALDPPTGVLLINHSLTVPAGEAETRRQGCALVTNNPDTQERDLLFRETEFRQAITDYFGFAGRGLLVLADAVRKHDPATKIEPDGFDERGRRFRFAPDINNGQIAVIAMCWAALRQQGFARQLGAFDEMADLDVFSVGVPEAPEPTPGGRTMQLAGGTVYLGRDGWPIEPTRVRP